MFITTEGVEGSGKTTQIRMLYDALKAIGCDVILTREPGGCQIADQIRTILLHADNISMIPRTELLLYAAARAQHIADVIAPALAAGKVVLCDRFTDSTLSYQGARGLEKEQILMLNDYATGGLEPDLTLLFDLPVKIGVKRSLDRLNGSRDESRFELEAIMFHEKVRKNFLRLAAQKEQRFRIIDANRPAAIIHADVLDLVVEATWQTKMLCA